MLKIDVMTELTWNDPKFDNEHHWRKMAATRVGIIRVARFPEKAKEAYLAGAALAMVRWLTARPAC